eukprot:scaffold169137_cov41-Prasinocladus_malaysianus.AAC.2
MSPCGAVVDRHKYNVAQHEGKVTGAIPHLIILKLAILIMIKRLHELPSMPALLRPLQFCYNNTLVSSMTRAAAAARHPT